MKNLLRTFNFFMAFIAILFMYSCQDEAVPEEPSGVEFIFSGDRVSTAKAGAADFKKNGESCDMAFASYAVIEMAGTSYTIDLKTWGDNFKTDLIELPPGTYEVTSSQLYDADNNPLYATPKSGSEFGQFVNQPLPFNVNVENYRKIEYDLEALCIEEFTPPQFGFIFWDIAIREVKNLCIFANYCESETGHKVASLDAFIYPNASETSEEDLIWSGSADGDFESGDVSNELLCLKFPYDPSIPKEEQSYYIELFVNGVLYEGTMPLDKIDLINEEDGYLHLNENCDEDYDIFTKAGCETAFALGNNTFTELGLTNGRWGWAHEFTEVQDGTYTLDIWAGAGQNNTSNGVEVGLLTVEVSGSDITVTYDMSPGYTMSETHLYLGDDMPTTVAPGQYGNINNLEAATSDSFTVSYSGDGNFWIIAHAVVCE
ncbi:hypothetical protein [Psychroflexus sediminis]|uniref:DUF5013 domain-containing protein n=1 Tax=Psychroflexus sediminis TaxID=470826 RepID=A0A1G7USK6_9FLAO|nr:hypothetical protein [Psychroflexus sediminis]SDG50467.1 hypothetical protein SAMN04488027_102258 [Psychroflexus sediminis]